MRNVEHGADKDAGEKWWIGNADTDPLDSGPSADYDAGRAAEREAIADWLEGDDALHVAAFREGDGLMSILSALAEAVRILPPGEPA